MNEGEVGEQMRLKDDDEFLYQGIRKVCYVDELLLSSKCCHPEQINRTPLSHSCFNIKLNRIPETSKVIRGSCHERLL